MGLTLAIFSLSYKSSSKCAFELKSTRRIWVLRWEWYRVSFCLRMLCICPLDTLLSKWFYLAVGRLGGPRHSLSHIYALTSVLLSRCLWHYWSVIVWIYSLVSISLKSETQKGLLHVILQDPICSV